MVSWRLRIRGDPARPWTSDVRYAPLYEVHDTSSARWRSHEVEPLAKFVYLVPPSRLSEEQLGRLRDNVWDGATEAEIYGDIPTVADLLSEHGLPLTRIPAKHGGPILTDQAWAEKATALFKAGGEPGLPPGVEEYRELWNSLRDGVKPKRKRGRPRKTEASWSGQSGARPVEITDRTQRSLWASGPIPSSCGTCFPCAC